MRAERGRVLTERRLHVPELPAEGGEVTLDQTASGHVRVLRLRPGDPVRLFDGRGREAEAELQSVDETVTCVAKPPIRVTKPGPRLVLGLSIPKGGVLDECVRMATELGVHEVMLLRAQRSVPRWDEARARSRVERLERIAVEAAAQCERSDLPVVHLPRTVEEWAGKLPAGVPAVVFGARAEGRFTLDEVPEQVWCAVGPEGGFTDDELAMFRAAGFQLASLGPTILRVDTAVASGLTVIAEQVRVSQAR